MKKLLKHMKLIHFIFLILGGVMLLSALPFKTQYNMVYINTDGNIADATGAMTNARGQDQSMLFEFYENKGATLDKVTVYNFQNDLNDVNNLILIFGVVMVLAVCLLFILQNANRKIYYGSNVAGAFLVCVGIAVFAIIVVVKLLGLMGTVNANAELFNNVSLLQDPATRAQVLQNPSLAAGASAVNATTLLAYMVMFVLCIVYAIFVLILTFAKFSRTKERRKEIISKAVENND